MSNILHVKDANGNWIPITAITGAKGETGATGASGVSCTHSWNGTVLTITSASGTSSADLKGPKGEAGGMQASVYDPQGKAQDIFAYVDAAIGAAMEASY